MLRRKFLWLLIRLIRVLFCNEKPVGDETVEWNYDSDDRDEDNNDFVQ